LSYSLISNIEHDRIDESTCVAQAIHTHSSGKLPWYGIAIHTHSSGKLPWYGIAIHTHSSGKLPWYGVAIHTHSSGKLPWYGVTNPVKLVLGLELFEWVSTPGCQAMGYLDIA
jgi:hypothetical protein